MSSLIVALNPPSSRSGLDVAYALTDDGQAPTAHGTVAPDLLPQATETVAVVPARLVSWHRPVLPKAPLNRLPDVLQGVLEEHLLDDPQSLHFALQPGAKSLLGSGEPVWVAACDKAWLRAALEGLEAAGRRVTRVVPELEPGGNQWWVYGAPQMAWVVQAEPEGVTVLPLEAVQGRPTLPVFAEPAVAAQAEKQFGGKVSLRQGAQQLVQAAQSAWNLAQFDMATAGRRNAGQKALLGWQSFAFGPQWRAVRWGLSAALLIQFAAVNAWAWKEQSLMTAKRSQIRQLYTQAFPEQKQVIDPMAQMQRDVAALQAAVGQPTPRDFEVMLSALAAALPEGKPAAGMEFRPGELRLKGLSLGEADLRALAAKLAPAGYAVSSQADGLTVTFSPPRSRP